MTSRAVVLANLASSNILEVDSTTDRVGIGSTQPTTRLDVSGDIKAVHGNFTGVVTATTGTFNGPVTIGGTLTYEDVTNIDVVGVITARSDVSIADKIIHTGDTNTAIRFPANDTFTVETAGSERLRVNSAGDLQVGTITNLVASGAGKLNILADDTTNLGIATDSAINIACTSGSGVGRVQSINWVPGFNVTLPTASIGYVCTDAGGYGKGDIFFATRGATTNTAATERLRIASNGAITATANFTTGGSIISEANPEASDTTNGAMLDKVKVVVRNAAGQSVWLGYKNGTSGATSSINVDGDTTIRDLTVRTVTSSDQIISNRSGTSVCFRAQSGGTDKFVVQADGDVGVGTDSPATKLHVVGTTPTFRIANGSTQVSEIKADTSATMFRTLGSHALLFGTNDTERLRITSDGKFGFKTTTPNYTVDINGEVAITEGQPITWHDGSGNASGQIFAQSDDSLVFRTTSSGSERMRITSGGNIGIGGVTNPEDYNASANTLVSGGGITLANATQGSIFFADSASGTGEYIGQINYFHSGNEMTFVNNGSERMRFLSGGEIGFNCTFRPQSGHNGVFFDSNIITIGSDTTAGQDRMRFENPNNRVGSISATATGVNYNTSSDYRLKENVVDITDGITRVKQLSPRRFNFIADDTTTLDGFLAHEAQTVVPEAVTGTHNEVDDDGKAVMQNIDQSKLVPLLTAALQEAISEIESLKTRVTALESS